ncbi:MAG: BglII/BstYI family type II restriction endonuclease [Pseudomonadota bacterium]
MLYERLPEFVRDHYECHEWKHASAILSQDFPQEWADIMDVLAAFRLRRSWIEVGGGSKSQVSAFIDEGLYARGWEEKKFQTSVMLDGRSIESPTHQVDCYRNGIALEIEWNNKDPFFDRDLNNFRLLFDLRAVSVGVIITRADGLQGIFNDIGRGSSYGQSTTHMSKLLPKIEGGGAAGCPLLVFGITPKLYLEDEDDERGRRSALPLFGAAVSDHPGGPALAVPEPHGEDGAGTSAAEPLRYDDARRHLRPAR